MAEPEPRSIPILVGDAIRETQDLVSKEFALLRTELGEGLNHLIHALTLFIAAGVVAITGVLVLILALVEAFAVLLHRTLWLPLSLEQCSRQSALLSQCGAVARPRFRGWSRFEPSDRSNKMPPSSRSAWAYEQVGR